MSKIVCDICGTSYDDTVGACPVCGWNQTGELPSDNSDFDDDFLVELEEEETPAAPAAPAPVVPAPEAKKPAKAELDKEAIKGRRPVPKPAKPAPKQEDDEDEDEEEEEESGSNAFLVIILVILILALLAVSAYIGWTKILKPRQMGSEDNKPQETITAQVENPTENNATVETILQTPVETVGQGEGVEDTTPVVPCTELSLAGNVDTLFIGQYWRLMAKAVPENTTEKVVYNSSNESVITIDEYGRVTAVGEGEAKITVTCGSQRLETSVVVKSSETDVTEAATTPVATPAEGTSGNTAVTNPAGTTVATPTGSFALKKHDITIGRRGVYVTLEIEGGVAAESVKWSTSDSSVATVYNGNVTCIGRGVCIITAEYNGQTEQCIVRCKY